MDRIQGAYDEATALEELTRRRKADAEAAREATRGARGGGEGRRGAADAAAREAERGREAVTKLIASLQAEQDAMRATDPLQQEMIKLRERMTYATAEQRVTIEDLLRTQLAEGEALGAQADRFDRIRDAGGQALDTVTQKLREGASAGDLLSSVLSGIGDRLISLGSGGLSDILFGKQGDAGGGVLGSILGSILPFAQGGVVTSPALFGFGGGRVGLMGEAGPEAIMPLGSSGMVGARVGGRETRLPLTRLTSGDLGVSVTPFARGGVLTPGPLAWASVGSAGGGASGAAGGGQDRLRIELALSQDLEARLLEEAGAQADVKITRGLKQFDRALPRKVDRIRKDSSYRGSR